MRKVFTAICSLLLGSQIAQHSASAGEGEAGQPPAADHQAQIEQFERGLRPTYGVQGQDPIVWSLEERMRHHDVPGVSIAVAIDGKLAWAKAYGVADTADGRAVDTDTLFQAASLSKPVASLAGLALVQDGLLSLDGPVNVHLKRWKVPANQFTQEQDVTLRHLMSHRAGTNVHGFRGYKTGEPIPTLPQILDGEAPANTDRVRVSKRPGESYRYSGGGFTILQLAIEDAIGQSFSEVVRGRIFHPAGMERSNFDYPSTHANIAIGHRSGEAQSMKGAMLAYPELAAAGLWTTPSELVTLGSLVAQARASGNFILEEGLARELVPNSADAHGLGFGLNDAGDGVAFVHSGHNPGYSARWINYADGRASVVILTNSDNGGALIREMLSGLGHVYGWQQDAYQERAIANLTQVEKDDVAGEYLFDAGDEQAAVIISNETGSNETGSNEIGQLWIQGAVIERTRLYPQSASKFFVAQGLNFKLERGATGGVVAIDIEGEIRLVKR